MFMVMLYNYNTDTSCINTVHMLYLVILNDVIFKILVFINILFDKLHTPPLIFGYSIWSKSTCTIHYIFNFLLLRDTQFLELMHNSDFTHQ